MKKTLHLLLVAALLACSPGLRAQEPGQKVTVRGIAFYNLENLFDTINDPNKNDEEFLPESTKKWDSQKYWSKIRNMAYAISQLTTKTTPHGPAIIGISEIESEVVVRDLVNSPQLAPWGLKYVHHDSPDRRGIDVGLLYNPRQFELLHVTHHRLDIGYPTRDQTCVVGTMLGQKIAVIVNHWPSRLGGQEKSSPNREKAADLTRHIADSLWKVDPAIGVIVMGDLNDDPMDKSVAVNLGAKKERKGIQPHQFYNPWWKTLDSGVGTLAYKGKWNLFDQIIISGNLCGGLSTKGWSYWKNIVHNKEFLRDREGTRQGMPLRTWTAGRWLNGYSDHFPTEIFLYRIIP